MIPDKITQNSFPIQTNRTRDPSNAKKEKHD